MQVGLPGHQLVTESATPWGSRLLMIDRVLEQERALAKILSADKKTRPLVFTWQDIRVLEAVQKALKPLQDFTDTLSGEEYVTLSYVILFILLNIASFVDPRFKAKYIPSEKMDALKQKVVMEAESLLGDQGRSCELPEPDPAVPEPAEQGEAAVAVPPATKKKKSLASFFKHDTVTSTTHIKRERIENELTSYLQSVSEESDADPLKWCREHEVAFPALSCIAMKFLCVPATSSPSERVFSCSSNIVTCYRASLKTDTVDRLCTKRDKRCTATD